MQKIIGLLLLLATSCGVSQSPAPQMIIWDKSSSNCKVIYKDGEGRERIEGGAFIIDVWPPHLQDKHVVKVMVGIIDVKPGDLDVNPASFDVVADDADNTVLPFTNADDVIAKEERHTRRMQAIGNGLAGFGAGMQTQSATVNNSDGSSSTVTYHDPSATANVSAAAAARGAQASEYYGRISSSILRRNTLEIGGYVVGWVYFSHPKGLSKNAEMRFVDVSLAGTTYRFPFHRIDGKKK